MASMRRWDSLALAPDRRAFLPDDRICGVFSENYPDSDVGIFFQQTVANLKKRLGPLQNAALRWWPLFVILDLVRSLSARTARMQRSHGQERQAAVERAYPVWGFLNLNESRCCIVYGVRSSLYRAPRDCLARWAQSSGLRVA